MQQARLGRCPGARRRAAMASCEPGAVVLSPLAQRRAVLGWPGEKGRGQTVWLGGVLANDELSEDFAKWPQSESSKAQLLGWLAERRQAIGRLRAGRETTGRGLVAGRSGAAGRGVDRRPFGIHGQSERPTATAMQGADLALYQRVGLRRHVSPDGRRPRPETKLSAAARAANSITSTTARTSRRSMSAKYQVRVRRRRAGRSPRIGARPGRWPGAIVSARFSATEAVYQVLAGVQRTCQRPARNATAGPAWSIRDNERTGPAPRRLNRSQVMRISSTTRAATCAQRFPQVELGSGRFLNGVTSSG